MIVELLLAVAVQVAPSGDEVDGVFSEPAQKLEEGKRYLGEGRVEDAIEAFRAMDIDDDGRRAAIEYNVGRALALDAARMKKEADAKEDKKEGEVDPELVERLRQAASAFERAYEMSDDARVKSESATAAGNAYVRAEALSEAIEQYRRSLVADPQNERARRNLSRALRMLRAQPPSPPEKSDKQKDDDDEDKDKDQQQQEQQQQDQKDEQKKEKGEKKKGERDEKKKEKKDEDEKKKGEKKKDEENKKQQGDDGDKDKKKEEKKDENTGERPFKTKKERDRERARQLLDAMRSRERPLDPQIMREHTEPPPRSGREW